MAVAKAVVNIDLLRFIYRLRGVVVLLPICDDKISTYYVERGWGFGPRGSTIGSGFCIADNWGDGDSDYGDGFGNGGYNIADHYEHD